MTTCVAASQSPGSRIIGGMFGLDLGTQSPRGVPAFLAEPHLLLANGRSAFTLLAETLRPARVWLPSYLCGVVVDAFRRAPSQIRFYAVGDRLTIADDAWLGEIEPGDMVVFIDYFGFTTWTAHGEVARSRGAWIVEDACQAMLNDAFSSQGHYVVVSPRKFVGVPDGGVLIARGGANLPDAPRAAAPAEWWLTALEACQRRRDFDRYGGDRQWFQLFQMAENMSPAEPKQMSDLTVLLLQHRLDYGEAALRRRHNYRFLGSQLADLAVLGGDCPAGVVPLGFPIRVPHRDAVRRGLFGADIYPPVHWPLEGIVPDEFTASRRLATEILTLPCDQRYSELDLRRIVARLKSVMPRSGATPPASAGGPR